MWLIKHSCSDSYERSRMWTNNPPLLPSLVKRWKIQKSKTADLNSLIWVLFSGPTKPSVSSSLWTEVHLQDFHGRKGTKCPQSVVCKPSLQPHLHNLGPRNSLARDLAALSCKKTKFISCRIRPLKASQASPQRVWKADPLFAALELSRVFLDYKLFWADISPNYVPSYHLFGNFKIRHSFILCDSTY